MFRTDVATASATLPTPAAAGTPGYFTNGNPGTGTPATVLDADWANMLQEELIAVVVAAGLTPSKTTRTQVRDAILALQSVGRTGKVFMHAANTAPAGALKANGAAVSRTTYASLFAVIGTVFGVGDGSTTFNLPDLQGAFLRGTGTGSINSRNKVGPSVGSFQEDQFQGHGHNIRYDNVGSGEEIIDSVSGDNSGLNVIEVKQPAGDAGYFEADSNGTPRHGSETRPYNAGVMYCIKY